MQDFQKNCRLSKTIDHKKYDGMSLSGRYGFFCVCCWLYKKPCKYNPGLWRIATFQNLNEIIIQIKADKLYEGTKRNSSLHN